jgi:uncharacterized protein (DUF1697 family)
MVKYIAFLRGINVGGHKIIKMTELAEIFESLGLSDVKTYIQSGNVWFSSAETREAKLVALIEKGLNAAQGYEVSVILRSTEYLRSIIADSPFTGKIPGKEEKFYVTFYPERLNKDFAYPIQSPKNDYVILGLKEREVYSYSILLPGGSYGNAGIMVEKLFGANGTTRNWNTVLKMV